MIEMSCGARSHDVHVEPVEAEVQAGGVNVIDLAELALVHAPAQLAHGGIELEGVPGHQNHAGPARLGGQEAGIGERGGDRLLDQHVLAGLQRLQGDLGMVARRGRHHHGINMRQGRGKVGEAAHGREGLVIAPRIRGSGSITASPPTPARPLRTRTCLEPQ
jgi:hypothetical protein